MAHKKVHHKRRHHHVSAHDKAVDRRNLSHARKAKHHGHHEEHEEHKSHHKGHHLSHKEAEHMLEEKYGGHKGGELSHLAHRAHDRAAHRHARVHGEHYAGMEPRRRQELEDAGMIHEDHNEVANMPQHVIMRPYDLGKMSYIPEDLDDTMHGVDRQISEDDHQRSRGFKPHKY